MDCHAHLEEIADLDEALNRAQRVGVAVVIAVGSDLESNRVVLEIGEKWRGFVYPALGLHPWDLDRDYVAALGFIKSNLDRGIALGEVGLDYRIDVSVKLQREAFRAILSIASMSDKPVIVHARGAWKDAYSLVRRFRIERAVFHWYSGSLDLLRQILDDGYYVSATPAAAYSPRHGEAISATPLERILLETDSPVVYRGIPAEPAHLVKALKAVARLKGVSPKEVAIQTTKNASQLFRL